MMPYTQMKKVIVTSDGPLDRNILDLRYNNQIPMDASHVMSTRKILAHKEKKSELQKTYAVITTNSTVYTRNRNKVSAHVTTLGLDPIFRNPTKAYKDLQEKYFSVMRKGDRGYVDSIINSPNVLHLNYDEGLEFKSHFDEDHAMVEENGYVGINPTSVPDINTIEGRIARHFFGPNEIRLRTNMQMLSEDVKKEIEIYFLKPKSIIEGFRKNPDAIALVRPCIMLNLGYNYTINCAIGNLDLVTPAPRIYAVPSYEMERLENLIRNKLLNGHELK